MCGSSVDSLWTEECGNDLYEAGVTDDKLAMVYEGNLENKVSISTPVGLSDRVPIPNIICQGGVMGSLLCGIQTDNIGKNILEKDEYSPKNETNHQKKCLYYKDEVEIPGLVMVDDIAAIGECGVPSVEVNAYIKAKIESKKLYLNPKKCHKMHIGKEDKSCPDLKAHEENMEGTTEEKYIGDIISKDGKNRKNIKSRTSRSVGNMINIMNILSEVSLGQFHFIIGKLLRETIFLSFMLINSETWVKCNRSKH